MPVLWELAEVVTLYKKGNVEDPENYRPISLLYDGYKVVAALVLNRMAEGGVEERLRPTQFGFRKCMSTSQAILIVKRIMDRAERTGKPLHLIFLDHKGG